KIKSSRSDSALLPEGKRAPLDWSPQEILECSDSAHPITDNQNERNETRMPASFPDLRQHQTADSTRKSLKSHSDPTSPGEFLSDRQQISDFTISDLMTSIYTCEGPTDTFLFPLDPSGVMEQEQKEHLFMNNHESVMVLNEGLKFKFVSY
ncbi:hypothetical protein LY78DRAFT_709552, partial [Colletotrichum sublineola]